MKKIAILILILFAGPVFASLEITEIMYDLEGSDAGLEWVEVHNVGSTSIDVSQWFFLEGGTYHGMSPEGFTELGAGEYAVIVQDLTAYSSGLSLVKSSFSLSNTGESLSLADENKVTKDDVDYVNTWGAAGDGNSLQLVGGSWISASSSLGYENSATSNNSEPEQSNTNEASTASKKSKPKEKTFYKGNIEVPDIIFVGEAADVSTNTYRVRGGDSMRKLSGEYLLNFGDGNAIQQKEPIDTQHIYRYPGTYTLVFEYYTSRLGLDADKDPVFLEMKTINVVEPQVLIAGIHGSNGLEIENTSAKQVDISGWAVNAPGSSYIFPRYSYLQGKQTLILSAETLGFSPRNQSLTLVGSHGGMMSRYPRYVQQKKKITNTESVITAPESITEEAVILEPEIASLTEPLKPKKPTKNNNIPLVGAGIFSVITGVMYYLRKQKETNALISDDVIGEIELIED